MRGRGGFRTRIPALALARAAPAGVGSPPVVYSPRRPADWRSARNRWTTISMRKHTHASIYALERQILQAMDGMGANRDPSVHQHQHQHQHQPQHYLPPDFHLAHYSPFDRDSDSVSEVSPVDDTGAERAGRPPHEPEAPQLLAPASVPCRLTSPFRPEFIFPPSAAVDDNRSSSSGASRRRPSDECKSPFSWRFS